MERARRVGMEKGFRAGRNKVEFSDSQFNDRKFNDNLRILEILSSIKVENKYGKGNLLELIWTKPSFWAERGDLFGVCVCELFFVLLGLPLEHNQSI